MITWDPRTSPVLVASEGRAGFALPCNFGGRGRRWWLSISTPPDCLTDCLRRSLLDDIYRLFGNFIYLFSFFWLLLKFEDPTAHPPPWMGVLLPWGCLFESHRDKIFTIKKFSYGVTVNCSFFECLRIGMHIQCRQSRLETTFFKVHCGFSYTYVVCTLDWRHCTCLSEDI